MFALVSKLCNPLHNPSSESQTLAKISFHEFTYKTDTKIFGEKEPADFVYQVMSGAVRSYKLLSDGRRQIEAFHFAGDIFGLGIFAEHRFTAEAIVDTTARQMTRRSLELAAESNVAVTLKMISETTLQLQHAEDHLLLLGQQNSVERVAAFLIEMDRRLKHQRILALPMNRRDIADYLGLTLETIARAMHSLQVEGLIGFIEPTHRHIVVLDRERLAGLDL